MMHSRLINFLLPGWVALFCVLYPRAVRAATLAEQMGAYDFRSLAWAAGIALFGGGVRTIVSLAGDSRPVFDVLREVLRDALISLVSGAAAFVLLEALQSSKWLVLTGEWRFAAIAVAGWARLSFFGWLRNLGGQLADMGTDWLIGQARRIAGVPPTVPPVQPPKDTP